MSKRVLLYSTKVKVKNTKKTHKGVTFLTHWGTVCPLGVSIAFISVWIVFSHHWRTACLFSVSNALTIVCIVSSVGSPLPFLSGQQYQFGRYEVEAYHQDTPGFVVGSLRNYPKQSLHGRYRINDQQGEFQ